MEKERKLPEIFGQLDPRLNPFEAAVYMANYQKTYQKTFTPLNLQKELKIFKLHDPESFLNPQSCMLIIKGRIVIENDNGQEEPVKPVSRMRILAVSCDYPGIPGS